MPFRICALLAALFAPLFRLPDDDMRAHGAVRQRVDRTPGFPCRVSLADAVPAETVLLVHYEHQSARTPYRAAHAIYVRDGVAQAEPAVGEIPAALAHRLLSVRAFVAAGMMVEGEVVKGRMLAPVVEAMLARDQVAYLRLHDAKPGCYVACVDRA